MPGGVAIVTDSTACLPKELVDRHDITVVPLQVIVGTEVFDEGEQAVAPAAIAQALRAGTAVSTSRPSPSVMAATYERLVADGAEAIVSVHLSAEMSGTFESAQLAARSAAVPVLAVDTRHVGAATGFAVLSGVAARDAGGSGEQVAAAVRQRAGQAQTLFYVDTLEFLRRGGRIGAAQALLGGALAVKPLLEIVDGRVATAEKVRTAARALARLEELVVLGVGNRRLDLCVSHLAADDRARTLADQLSARLREQLEGREVWCTELGAVVGAHVGPGMVAVSIAPLSPVGG